MTPLTSLGDKVPSNLYWQPGLGPSVAYPLGPERYCAYQDVISCTRVHFHATAELTLVLEGTGGLRIAGCDYPVGPDTLAFAPPNALHGQPAGRPLTKVACVFSFGLVESLLAPYQALTPLLEVGDRMPAAVTLDPRQGEEVRNLMQSLLAEYAEPTQPGSGAVVAAVLTQVLVRFLRISSSLATSPQGNPQSEDEDFARLLAYVQQHFTEPINRSSVARALQLRPERISRLFRQLQSGSFTANLTRLRLCHAVELLQATPLGTTEIGHLSGFDSYRTFARAFSSAYACSPSAFRKSHLRDGGQGDHGSSN